MDRSNWFRTTHNKPPSTISGPRQRSGPPVLETTSPATGGTKCERQRSPAELSILVVARTECQRGISHRRLVLQSRIRFDPCERDRKRGLRFVPQDFHNCGKHCGKRGRLAEYGPLNRGFAPLSEGRSVGAPDFSAFGRRRGAPTAARRALGQAKVPFSTVFLVILNGYQYLGPDPGPDRNQS